MTLEAAFYLLLPDVSVVLSRVSYGGEVRRFRAVGLITTDLESQVLNYP